MKSVEQHNRLTQILRKSFTFLLVLSFSFTLQAQDGAVDEARQKEGKKLFKSLCASCHKLDKKLIGPALGKVEERREFEWLKAWIKDNAALRSTGDTEANAIFDEYKGSNMTAFPQLTDKNIEDILYYTTVGEIKKAPAPGEVVEGGNATNSAPKWLLWILAAAIIVAFLIIASLLKTISELKGAPKTAGALGSLSQLWEGFKKNTFLKSIISNLWVVNDCLCVVWLLV